MEFAPKHAGIDDLQLKALKNRYSKVEDHKNREKDLNGRIVVRFKDPDLYLDIIEESKTQIDDLEAKLARIKAEKARAEKHHEEGQLKAEKKLGKKDKKKKQKQHLSMIRSVFNNAPIMKSENEDEDPDSDVGKYKTTKKGKKVPKSAKVEDNVTEEKYPQRFAPILASVLTVADELDRVRNLVEADMAKPGGTRMYKAQQFANLISITNSKLSCSKELHNIAKTMSSLEIKQESKKDEDSDNTKVINSLGLKILRGEYDNDDVISKKRNDKKKDKKSRYDDDDGDWNKKSKTSDKELAEAFGDMVKNGGAGLTNHEKYIHLEGKYKFAVVVPEDDQDDWKFIAIDPKKGKRIKDFPKDLLPVRKGVKLKFDYDKGRATDKLTKESYSLIIKD